jgi:TonB family protein
MKLTIQGITSLLVLFVLSFSAVSQSRIDYLDPQFNVVKDSATCKYVRAVNPINDSLYNVEIKYRTGELMMIGAYKDASLKVAHGDFKYYYANGIVESEGKCRNGNKVGTWKRWSYDGTQKPDRQYVDENFKRTNRTTASAKFPGGIAALQQMVNDSLQYPAEARERRIEGTVYVTFTIDTSGEVRNPEISEGVFYLLDEEAMRFVSTMPTWTPATRNGIPVESSFIMPITFSITQPQSPASPQN